MEGGYPSVADIEDLLLEEGVEEITDYNTNFRTEFLQFLHRLLMRTKFAAALNVYCPTTTTFNIVEGSYYYKGVVKTYTPGVAVNPTDNDTTYIWLTSDNELDYGIDGDGWPAADHIKLGEIDVDADGIITAVRDLRGQTFLNRPIRLDEIVCHENEFLCYENEPVTI